jgi:uncharacterized protein (UPF0147 family)
MSLYYKDEDFTTLKGVQGVIERLMKAIRDGQSPRSIWEAASDAAEKVRSCAWTPSSRSPAWLLSCRLYSIADSLVEEDDVDAGLSYVYDNEAK